MKRTPATISSDGTSTRTGTPVRKTRSMSNWVARWAGAMKTSRAGRPMISTPARRTSSASATTMTWDGPLNNARTVLLLQGTIIRASIWAGHDNSMAWRRKSFHNFHVILVALFVLGCSSGTGSASKTPLSATATATVESSAAAPEPTVWPILAMHAPTKSAAPGMPTAPAGTSQGDLTAAAIDLFVLSNPPCKVTDFRFIINSKMVVAACRDASFEDFAGMFLINGTWQGGIWDTKR